MFDAEEALKYFLMVYSLINSVEGMLTDFVKMEITNELKGWLHDIKQANGQIQRHRDNLRHIFLQIGWGNSKEPRIKELLLVLADDSSRALHERLTKEETEMKDSLKALLDEYHIKYDTVLFGHEGQTFNVEDYGYTQLKSYWQDAKKNCSAQMIEQVETVFNQCDDKQIKVRDTFAKLKKLFEDTYSRYDILPSAIADFMEMLGCEPSDESEDTPQSMYNTLKTEWQTCTQNVVSPEYADKVNEMFSLCDKGVLNYKDFFTQLKGYCALTHLSDDNDPHVYIKKLEKILDNIVVIPDEQPDKDKEQEPKSEPSVYHTPDIQKKMIKALLSDMQEQVHRWEELTQEFGKKFEETK